MCVKLGLTKCRVLFDMTMRRNPLVQLGDFAVYWSLQVYPSQMSFSILQFPHALILRTSESFELGERYRLADPFCVAEERGVDRIRAGVV